MGFKDFVVKYALIFLNLPVAICSIVLIVMGSALIYVGNNLQDFLPDDRPFLAIPVTVTSCIFFIISLIGCLGSVRESSLLLNTYAVSVLLLTAASTVVLGLLNNSALRKKNDIHSFFGDGFSDPEARLRFFVVEVILECCGPSGPISYELIDVPMPPNCCPQFGRPPIHSIDDVIIVGQLIHSYNGTKELCTKEEAYGGCVDIAFAARNSIYYTMIYLLTIILLVELLASVFAFYLAQHIRHKPEININMNLNTQTNNRDTSGR